MYKESEFNKCLFNPCVVDMFVQYPQLSKIQSISDKIDNKLMKYIVCVYDYRSPIVTNNRELKIRKQLAAEFVGYNIQKDDLKPIYNIEYDYLLKAIDTFLKLFIHSRTWYMICCNESIFWEYGQRMLASVIAFSVIALPPSSLFETDYKRLYGDEQSNKFIKGATTPERIAAERNVRKN